jgi:predicted tellurium resistance membrane protein TerC
MFFRLALLASLSWLIGLTAPLFTVMGNEISARDAILLGGGLFLIWKSTLEIHEKLENTAELTPDIQVANNYRNIIMQIIMIDIIFSLDSIITAVGMANQLAVMMAAVVIAVGFMMLFSASIGEFVEQHPTIKMLALSFLIMIGIALVADGLDMHIPKGYIYFAMAFSVCVEMLNLRMHAKTKRLNFTMTSPTSAMTDDFRRTTKKLRLN